MRTLEINKRKIFYALRIGTEKFGDYDEAKPVYGEPQSIYIKVEYLNSSVYISEYGKTADCDVKLVTSKTSYPFDENTVFWIDSPISDPPDYVMEKLPKKSINGSLYYLKRAGVSNA